MAAEFNTAEYAKREEKSARWAAYFHQHGVTSHQVQQMALARPEWKQLAKAISVESGRKLLPPHSQETIDAIVRNLRDFEAAVIRRELSKSSI